MGIEHIDGHPGMSQATSFGEHVFVSGQVAWGADGEVVGEGDSRAQAEQVFVNLERVLGATGCSLADVVKLTCYLTDAAHFDGYAEVKARRYPDRGPASSTVVVAALLDSRLLLEVEAVAVRPV